MRRDDNAFELLLGDVSERKDRPVALMVFRARAHLDTPADTIGAGSGGNLEGLALVGVDFRRGSQVQRSIVAGNLYRFGRLHSSRRKGEHRQEKGCDHRDHSSGR